MSKLNESFIFHDQDDDFKEILADKVFDGIIREKSEWKNHLMLSFDDSETMSFGEIETYINLKYSNKLFSIKDFTPKNGVDYINRCPYGKFTSF